MPIESDIENLPTARGKKGDGIAPDPNPILSPVLGRALVRLSTRAPKTAPRQYVRPSDALKCARQLSYTALGLPGSEMDVPGALTVLMGTLVHEWLGPILENVAENGEPCWACGGTGHFDPDTEDDPPAGRDCADCAGTGSVWPWEANDINPTMIVEAIMGQAADLELEFDVVPHMLKVGDEEVAIFGYGDLVLGKVAAVDMKTINGTKFRKLVGVDGPALGAEQAWLIQAGIAALVFDCAKAIVLGVSKEAVSQGLAKRGGLSELDRIMPEWSRDMDEFGPIVEAELIRMWRINRLALTPVEHEVDGDTEEASFVADGILAARRIPGVPGEITNPLKGAWVARSPETGEITQTGNHWGCHPYCSFSDRCEADGPGRVYINPRPKEVIGAATKTDGGAGDGEPDEATQ